MSARPVLSFVIPVRNDALRLRRCLVSITSTARADIEIVVVDNGSEDGSAAVARSHGATVVSLPNRVVAEVRNAGARAATADLIAFVDADHELAPTWIASALAVMQDPDVAAAGADYHPPADSTWVPAMYDRLRRHPVRIEDTDWLPSGNLVVRRSIFEAVGGFDIALESCEDVDLCRRIRGTAGRLVAVPDLVSIHLGDPKTLRSVFLSELWRGRDNLRVSLRDRLTARNLAGLGFTVLYLLAVMVLAAGLLAWPVGGARWAAAGAAVIATLTAVRVARLVRAGGHLIESGRFALTFDTARAIALIVRVGHRTRRRE